MRILDSIRRTHLNTIIQSLIDIHTDEVIDDELVNKKKNKNLIL